MIEASDRHLKKPKTNEVKVALIKARTMPIPQFERQTDRPLPPFSSTVGTVYFSLEVRFRRSVFHLTE